MEFRVVVLAVLMGCGGRVLGDDGGSNNNNNSSKDSGASKSDSGDDVVYDECLANQTAYCMCPDGSAKLRTCRHDGTWPPCPCN